MTSLPTDDLFSSTLPTYDQDPPPGAEVEEDEAGLLQGPQTILRYILAGAAVVTLVSRRTGQHYTYRIQKGRFEASPLFVQVLTGPDNYHDYKYIGTIFLDGPVGDPAVFRYGSKAKVLRDAPSVKAFEWFAAALLEHGRVPSTVEVFHTGRCGRCGRKLTHPDSIQTGLGPVCSNL